MAVAVAVAEPLLLLLLAWPLLPPLVSAVRVVSGQRPASAIPGAPAWGCAGERLGL